MGYILDINQDHNVNGECVQRCGKKKNGSMVPGIPTPLLMAFGRIGEADEGWTGMVGADPKINFHDMLDIIC